MGRQSEEVRETLRRIFVKHLAGLNGLGASGFPDRKRPVSAWHVSTNTKDLADLFLEVEAYVAQERRAGMVEAYESAKFSMSVATNLDEAVVRIEHKLAQLTSEQEEGNESK